MGASELISCSPAALAVCARTNRRPEARWTTMRKAEIIEAIQNGA
jgi:hypothetical protein